MRSLGDAVLSGLSSAAALEHLFTLETTLDRLASCTKAEPWLISPGSVRLSADGPARLDALEMLARRWPALFGRRMNPSDRLYAAPECVTGKGDPARGLVYSIGMIACFCFHGSELPPSLFEAKTSAEGHWHAIHDLVRRLGVKNGLKTCLLRATSYDPAARQRTVHQLFEDLRGALQRHERPEQLDMIAIAGGELVFGAPSEGTRSPNSLITPRHVRISDFRISRHPITQAAYQHLIGSNPSREPHDPDAPVNRVAFRHAATFCNLLSRCEGLRPAYEIEDKVELDLGSDGYRLPTEAEWEYAARGPHLLRYPWGQEPPALQVCWNGPGNFFGEGNRRGPSAVGWHPEGASPFGVMDMAGNVWEWCHDLFQATPPTEGPVDNPLGPEESISPAGFAQGPYRVVRGGAWNIVNPIWLETTARAAEREEAEHDDIGFRVVRGRLR